MEDDIKNYLPTVMFRGTPCTFITLYAESISAWSNQGSVMCLVSILKQ